MIYFKDGQFLQEQQMNLSVNDRGYAFGDGVYEVIKVYDGVLYTAQEHLERFLESAKKIRMPIPYTIEQLTNIVQKLLEENQLSVGHIYLQVTRGVAPRAHQFPGRDVPPVMIGYTVVNPRPLEYLKMGTAMKSVEDMRWLRCDIKSLNLLGNVLAKQEALEQGCQEALFVRDGLVREGSASNVFGIKDGILHTHPANNYILNGITRRVVLQLAKHLAIPVEEKEFTLAEALAMDEFFFTSTNAEITPVITIDEKQIGEGVPGPLTRKLQSAFDEQIPMLVAAGNAKERESNGPAS
ncbi:D-amino-acid transaminase [Sporosarcina sp. P13]|uniref:D-amino-acid transaminase n=1 Tax=Sporosarcina sp. P13 TaxID=2048263 RepID=UPI000C1646A6|nr:D-amino-acid transaminase [Sporosarcina sp. P13]PIC65203.1 D-amino-acid transaminase [Sporosarcina sp. P13]